MMSAPSTPSRYAPDSPSVTLARARAALLLTPSLRTSGLTSPPQSSPSSGGLPPSSSSSPASRKSTRTSQTSDSPSPKRMYTAFSAPGQRGSRADETPDWRQRARSNGIKVATDSERDSSKDSASSGGLLPSPSLASTKSLPNDSQSDFVRRPPTQLQSPDSLFATPPSKQTSNSIRGNLTDPMPRSRLYSLESPFSRATHSNNSSGSSFTSTAPSSSDGSAQQRDLFSQFDVPPLQFPSLSTSSSPTACAVCGSHSSSSDHFSILEPCHHMLCSACITGSLNIVPQKDVTCVLCKAPVENFKLFDASPEKLPSSEWISVDAPARIMIEPLRLPKHAPPRVPNYPRQFDDVFTAHPYSRATTFAVLRVDNVPWDVTPPMLAAWVHHPIVAAYTLIDRGSGKTFSHAFIELANIDQARTVLRRCQNSILGKGKRTMAVTVTMSSPEELMTELYPTWPGKFIGNLPILPHPANMPQQYPSPSLLTHVELDSLQALIENPNPRFVKTPALPYYELIAILSKIPVHYSDCVPYDINDHLCELCCYALESLKSGIMHKALDLDIPLLHELERAISNCAAFPQLSSSSVPPTLFRVRSPVQLYPPVFAPRKSLGFIERFAEEFNVHPYVVSNLADRLAAM